VHPLLEVLRAKAAELGPALARSAFARGLAVTNPDGSARPIPITLTPVVASARAIHQCTLLSSLLSSAAVKMATAVLAGPDRELLVGALSPLERRVADSTYASARRFATIRVDYFVAGALEEPFALEINATIPAMQGYSDMAAECFIRSVGEAAALSSAAIEALIARNGSNAQALHQALLDGFALARGRNPERIGLLCRRNDAQLTELQYLAARFRELGTQAEVIFPDQLSGEDTVIAGGASYDLIYRHLFVRRLEESSAPYALDLFTDVAGRKAVVLNPPASQVEVKSTFALLSQASQDLPPARRGRLSEQELAAIRQAVPWTRLFRPGASSDSEGRPIADLVETVAAQPERFVLKRAWDYGGKAVFIGSASAQSSFDERTRAAFGEALSWPELCRRAAVDRAGGGFIVQTLIDARPESHVLCTQAGTVSAELYVDFSAYASVGLPRAPDWGGVCRGSPSQVVNIVGGGGVLPLITDDVAAELLAALKGAGRASKANPRYK
jgi:hypothetical protein